MLDITVGCHLKDFTFWQVISKTDDRILRNLSKLEKPDWLGKTTFEIYFLGQIVNQILYERKAKRMS